MDKSDEMYIALNYDKTKANEVSLNFLTNCNVKYLSFFGNYKYYP